MQGRQTRQNSGVAEVAKIEADAFTSRPTGSSFEKVHFLAFLPKAIKKRGHFKEFLH